MKTTATKAVNAVQPLKPELPDGPSWTPGEWVVKRIQTSCGVCFKVGSPEMVEASHGGICLYDDQTSLNPHLKGEQEANARLISAAPDLYVALKELAECSKCQNGCDPDDMTCASNLARAALSKALGR